MGLQIQRALTSSTVQRVNGVRDAAVAFLEVKVFEEMESSFATRRDLVIDGRPATVDAFTCTGGIRARAAREADRTRGVLRPEPT